MCTWAQVVISQRPEVSNLLKLELVGGHEPHDMGAEDWTTSFGRKASALSAIFSRPKIKNFKLHVFLFIVYMWTHECTQVTGRREPIMQVLRLGVCVFSWWAIISSCCPSPLPLSLPLRKESYYAAYNALELRILLLKAPDFWDCRQVLTHPTEVNFFK